MSAVLETWPPRGAQPVVSFTVQGAPRPAGSKDTGVVTRFDPELGRRVPVVNPATGMPRTFARDSSGAKGKNWRADVRQAVTDALDRAHELVDGPLAVRVTFFGDRARGHFGTGRNAGVLKATAPRYPHASSLADGSKLARALEDALTKLVWTDDRRVCEMWWSRAFAPRPGAHVAIYSLPAIVGVTLDEPDALSLLGPDPSVIMDGDEQDRRADIERVARSRAEVGDQDGAPCAA